ncbi:MAG: deoxyguanosinetriphosphate triphosphohydrolase [Candidatus Gastranaerophilales bacterium]|nr:deoxyguanosinetriphosphate triphosphohydrolase [Candidatus Gastranaerophilales bacterium]
MKIDGKTVRERIEEQERLNLSALASKSCCTKGRKRFEEPCELRTEFQRDRDRILHSKAFRRLKHKTQVFFSPYDDHFRTRMTHTLEVSQIARTISRALNLNEDLTEAIALGHDLGHTPFGHSGERVLNELMPAGYKHNVQSVRIVTFIEDLNLTQETIDGILNHSYDYNPSTLEGKVVRIADKIAYINHDIQDAIRAGIIKIEDIPKESIEYFSSQNRIRITKFLNDIVENSYGKDTILMSDECFKQFIKLREWMFDNVYNNSPAKQAEDKAQNVIKMLFEYYCEELKRIYPSSSEKDVMQTVCDYVSGMTDRYVLIKFEENFLPEPLIQKNHDEFLYKLAEMNGLK